MECKICINSEKNPTITINSEGLCNVCSDYTKKFNPSVLEEELIFIKKFIKNSKHDAMVAVSGGKDSSAMLYTAKQMGFTPLAVTFDIGFNNLSNSILNKIKRITEIMEIEHELINVKRHISQTDKKNFELLADLYDEPINSELKEKFLQLYAEGRKYYSTKIDIAFPFVRPCQVCRKVAVKAYYAEAAERNISIVFVGINEWAGLSNGSYSAIRKIQPFPERPAVYIVHLPYIVGRKYKDLPSILDEIKWTRENGDHEIDTGGSACQLAMACEYKANKVLDFHLDSARLSREILVGFITKEKAKSAIAYGDRFTEQTARNVLERYSII